VINVDEKRYLAVEDLYIAKLKGYMRKELYSELRNRYKECIRMLNGLEKTLEKKLPSSERRWQLSKAAKLNLTPDT